MDGLFCPCTMPPKVLLNLTGAHRIETLTGPAAVAGDPNMASAAHFLVAQNNTTFSQQFQQQNDQIRQKQSNRFSFDPFMIDSLLTFDIRGEFDTTSSQGAAPGVESIRDPPYVNCLESWQCASAALKNRIIYARITRIPCRSNGASASGEAPVFVMIVCISFAGQMNAGLTLPNLLASVTTIICLECFSILR
jgi:hypothetical protein